MFHVIGVDLIAGQQELVDALIRGRDFFFYQIIDPRKAVRQSGNLNTARSMNDREVGQLVRRQLETGQPILLISQGKPALFNRCRGKKIILEQP